MAVKVEIKDVEREKISWSDLKKKEDNVEHLDHQDAKRRNPVRNKLKLFCCMNWGESECIIIVE